MRTLIIGCGYLGKRVADHWRDRGDDVFALTRSPERAADWRSNGLNPIVGDVLDPSTLRDLPEADLCLYSVGYDRSAASSKRAVYVDGLQNALQVLVSRCQRMIYVSSTSVYGQDGGEAVNDSSPCDPATGRGRICLEAEQLVRTTYGAGKPFSAVILRLAGIYGPGRLLARREHLLAGNPLPGNPEGWLNLIHVDDAVDAILKLGHQPSSCADYLLSDLQPVRRRDFYSYLAELCGAPAPTFAGGDDSLGKRCDSSRVRRQLNLDLAYPTYRDGLPQALAAD